MPAFLLPLLGRLAPYLIAAAAVIGGVLWVQHQVLARRAAEAALAQAQAAVAGRDRAITAISARAAAMAAEAATSNSYRRAARAAPVSNACAASPAVGGYLGGLRATARPDRGAAAGAAPVPAGASAAGRASLGR